MAVDLGDHENISRATICIIVASHRLVLDSRASIEP